MNHYEDISGCWMDNSSARFKSGRPAPEPTMRQVVWCRTRGLCRSETRRLRVASLRVGVGRRGKLAKMGTDDLQRRRRRLYQADDPGLSRGLPLKRGPARGHCSLTALAF